MRIAPLFSFPAAAMAVLLWLSGCASTAEDALPEPSMQTEEIHNEGEPGSAQVRRLDLVALVTAINHDTREVTLKNDVGESTTLTVGPMVENLDQVEKGDKVHVVFYEQMVVYARPPGSGADLGSALLMEGAEKGQKPAGVIAEVDEIVAVVTAVDLEKHTATLRFPDGSEEPFAVWPDVELKEEHVGVEVVIQMTSAVGVKVDKI